MKIRLVVCLVLCSPGFFLAGSMRDASSALRGGRPGEALQVYLQIMAGGRDDAGVWYGVARAQYALDKLVASAAACDAALYRDGSHHGAWVLRGRVRLAQHRLPEAIRDFGYSLELRPDDGFVCGLMARALAMQGRKLESHRYATRAAETLPPNAGRLMGAVWSAAGLELWTEAEAWSRRASLAGARASDLAKILPRVQLALAGAERRKGRVGDALIRLGQLVTVWPQSSEAATARLQIVALKKILVKATNTR